MGAMR